MKTTLKRGMGRVATLNGDGRAVFPPGVRTPMRRYRQPERPRRSPWQVVRTVVLWVILSALVAHTAWHWTAERWERLRQFEAPALNAFALGTAVRWLMAVVVLAAVLWLIGLAARRKRGDPAVN